MAEDSPSADGKGHVALSEANKMRYVTLICVAVLLLPAFAGAQEVEEGFVVLFNGEDLTGWKVPNEAWKVEDGVMVCTGQGGGWIRTEGKYEDFVLRLEYSISPGGNSGVGIRVADQGNPAFSGMELQVLDDHGKPANKHTSMALYAAVAPTKNMSKPAGEWNQVEISCIGTELQVTFNGEKVIDCKLDDPSIDTGDHPKLMDRAKTGYIALQNHGKPVQYRNIRVKKLK
jgi:hypothetical protein